MMDVRKEKTTTTRATTTTTTTTMANLKGLSRQKVIEMYDVAKSNLENLRKDPTATSRALLIAAAGVAELAIMLSLNNANAKYR